MTPPRRWFAFSLRTMFVGVVLAAIPMGWLGWQLHIVRERERVRDWIEARHGVVRCFRGECYYPPDYKPLPLVRRSLGDQPARIIWLSTNTPTDEAENIKRLFPEADINLGDDMIQQHSEQPQSLASGRPTR